MTSRKILPRLQLPVAFEKNAAYGSIVHVGLLSELASTAYEISAAHTK